MRSKTDQEGASKLIPIGALLHSLIMEWQHRYKLEGVILRSIDRHGNIGDKLNSGSLGAILNRRKVSSGFKVKNCRFSGHSFRVGAAIDLLEAGVSLEIIMLRGRWRSEDNGLNYLRPWRSLCLLPYVESEAQTRCINRRSYRQSSPDCRALPA